MSAITRSGGSALSLADEVVAREEPFQLAAEEEIDADEQDPRHPLSVTLCSVGSEDPFARGLALIRDGAFFEAHEELEVAWRARRARSGTSSRGSSTSPSPGTRPGAPSRSRLRASSRRRSAASRRMCRSIAASTWRPCSTARRGAAVATSPRAPALTAAL